MNALVTIPNTNAEVYRASTDAAGLCKEIVVASALTIQGRKYVRVEGWQAIAIAHGCTGSARDVERIEGGMRAVGEIRRMSDGVVIAEAEGFVGEDEPTWYGGKMGSKTLPKRPDYAIRAMAQTRAISRACRSAFAHVVVMMNAGLSTTPAEEVPHGGFDQDDEPAPRPRPVPQRAPAVDAEFVDAPSPARKSAAQCKRDGDDVRIKTEIASLDRNGLKDWDVNFDAYTAHVPASWSDSIRDMLEARLVELDGEDAVRSDAAEMDAGFSGAVAA